MKRLGNIFIIINIVALLLWLIPLAYATITARPDASPFTLYSATIHDFTVMDVDGNGNYTFTDTHGRHYTGPKAEQVQSLFYYQDLAANSLLPDSIEGTPVDVETIGRTNFIFSLSPSDLNKPQSKACLLMESKPKRARLSAPKEGFYSDHEGLHIVRLADNTEDTAKSHAFTRALAAAAFAFPIRLWSGNPDPQKEYDEGYMLTDSHGGLYQLKQVEGRPLVRHFVLPQGKTISRVQTLEFPDRKLRAIVCMTDSSVYLLDHAGRLHATAIRYDARTEDMMVIGDMFYMTVKVGTLTGERYYAVSSRDYSLKDTLTRQWPVHHPAIDYLLPLRIIMQTYNSGYVYPRLYSPWG